MDDFPGADEWTAAWIEPAERAGGPVLQRPAYHLAGEVTVPGPVESATLHVTAHGVYEVFVNGTRVGDAELTPGFTAYRRRLQVQTFDVTDLVVAGPNALGALLSDGWWRGRHGITRATDSYGPTTAFLAELHVMLDDGTGIVAGTDGSWLSTPSHVLGADLMAGEVHDLRRRVAGWSEPGTDRSAWDPVVVADHPYTVLCATTGPPVRRVDRLRAVSVTEVEPGRHVVDFGRNSNGWIRLDDLGPAGTTVTITYGEALDPAGDVTQDNVKASPFVPDDEVPFQTDVVTSAGDGSTFEPRHSTKGFRYVRIEGHPGPLDRGAVSSIVVHTDMRRRGSFRCSDERVNRLHDAAVWSFRANACDIPTDCPTRERSGWTGDWQAFVATAAYLYDVSGFSAKWLRDLVADQRPDGTVTNIVPDPHDMDADGPDLWRDIQGSAGWGDAVVHVPWEIHRATGRVDVLEECFDAMLRWVDSAARRAAAQRHPTRIAARPDPLPHETYIWDTGFHFGEWLEPGDDIASSMVRILGEGHGAVATAYLHRSAREVSAIARILGDDDAAARYSALASNVLDAWRTEFVDGDGRVVPLTQANCVRALAFGLVPDGLRDSTVDDLVALVRGVGTHPGTGFLSTPFLLPVLADAGHVDVAYDLLLQDTEPSWLAMIERGATTIWEVWEAIRPDGTAVDSLDHYGKGSVISFLHGYVGGLQLVEPGYRRFRVAPVPGGAITSARTHHDCPYGRIVVTWEIVDGAGSLDVAVPHDTVADVVLPDGRTAELTRGRHRLDWRAGAS